MNTKADRSSWKWRGWAIATDSLEVAGLTTLMRVTTGISKVAIGLIGGPVAANHPDLATENIRSLTAAAAQQPRTPALRFPTALT
jgi:hypothetical protein